ncbi:MAG: biotin/lipoate A/B protein ligase family protein [Candidatus Gracilibacteria bacterium]
MALDEVLINRIKSGSSLPSLRFYGWKPSAVSIGYFQSLEAEVDDKKCEELGIDIVRRQTGGGAVFHDQEVTYSIHIPLTLDLVPKKVLESYEKICNGIIYGLAKINLDAKFIPLNDIVVGGQKISGNAQTRKQGIILQHGTILKAVDVDKMFDILKVPDEKMKGKLISDIKQRVTSVDLHSNSKFSFQDIVTTLISGFKQAFPEVEFSEDSLTDEEKAETEKLASQKYSTKDWNYQR